MQTVALAICLPSATSYVALHKSNDSGLDAGVPVSSRTCAKSEAVRNLEASLVTSFEVDEVDASIRTVAVDIAGHLGDPKVEVQLVLRAGNDSDAIGKGRRDVESRRFSRTVEKVGVMRLLRRFGAKDNGAAAWPFEYERNRAKRARLPVGRVAAHAPELGIGTAHSAVEDKGREHASVLYRNHFRGNGIDVAVALARHSVRVWLSHIIANVANVRPCDKANGDGRNPVGLVEIEGWLRALMAAGGPYNLQLSGGEPTLRSDLPEIIALARSLGFSFIQLNTNGVLLQDAKYLRRLKSAGLDCVFLQFDGVTKAVYERIRGAAIVGEKKRAIELCSAAELGVVLVPTLVPGVNVGQIGEIIRFAIQQMPAVRAVHFQPVSYFGRYPGTPANSDRITLPEIMRQIELQTQSKIKASDFYPPSAENSHCSFQGKFQLQPDGTLKASPRPRQPVCCSPAGPEVNLVQLGNVQSGNGYESKRAREFVARQWVFPAGRQSPNPQFSSSFDTESLDAFLREGRRHTLTISGMAFQDAWNLDLQRLRKCFIHVVSPERAGNKLVPLCAYNLTDVRGRALYRTPDPQPVATEATHA